jgi:hypothetical protein
VQFINFGHTVLPYYWVDGRMPSKGFPCTTFHSLTPLRPGDLSVMAFHE